MKVHYYTAPCGAGKSHQAAKRMISAQGRYLVIRDRVEAIEEYANQLATMAMVEGVTIPIQTITNRRGSSVRLQVESVPADYGVLPHAIVLITHKAMMMCDFSEFHGWHVIIDETPVVLDREDIQTAQSVEFFDRNYQLDPLDKAGWSSVTLSDEGWKTTPRDLENDDCFRLLRVFHERVTAASRLPDGSTREMARRAYTDEASRRAVVSNLNDWQDMADGRRWTWWSLWSPRQLESFASVTFMANGFDKSVTFKMLRNLHRDIDWIEVPLASARQFASRDVTIEYFADQHVTSQTLFDSEEGRSNLKAIARHLSRRDQIWMANDRHATDRIGMGGAKLQPHQAGSNQYAGYHAATAIYAVKPSAETRAVMTFLDVDPEVWTHSYEYEAILQFVCRTSVRDPNSTAPVTMTVYDKDQADYLAEYFKAQPYCRVEVEKIDLAIHDEARERGRRPVVMTVEEAEEKKVSDKAKRAAAARERRAREKAKMVS